MNILYGTNELTIAIDLTTVNQEIIAATFCSCTWLRKLILQNTVTLFKANFLCSFFIFHSHSVYRSKAFSGPLSHTNDSPSDAFHTSLYKW